MSKKHFGLGRLVRCLRHGLWQNIMLTVSSQIPFGLGFGLLLPPPQLSDSLTSRKNIRLRNWRATMMVEVTGDNEVYHCQFDLILWEPKQLTLRIVDFTLLCGRSNDDLHSEWCTRCILVYQWCILVYQIVTWHVGTVQGANPALTIKLLPTLFWF